MATDRALTGEDWKLIEWCSKTPCVPLAGWPMTTFVTFNLAHPRIPSDIFEATRRQGWWTVNPKVCYTDLAPILFPDAIGMFPPDPVDPFAFAFAKVQGIRLNADATAAVFDRLNGGINQVAQAADDFGRAKVQAESLKALKAAAVGSGAVPGFKSARAPRFPEDLDGPALRMMTAVDREGKPASDEMLDKVRADQQRLREAIEARAFEDAGGTPDRLNGLWTGPFTEGSTSRELQVSREEIARLRKQLLQSQENFAIAGALAAGLPGLLQVSPKPPAAAAHIEPGMRRRRIFD